MSYFRLYPPNLIYGGRFYKRTKGVQK